MTTEKDCIEYIRKMKYYDKEGKQISLEEFGEKVDDSSYRIIKQDQAGKYLVSTVWLGLDCNFRLGNIEKRPIIFETVVFNDEDISYSEEIYGYHTEKDALKGHESVVLEYKKLCKESEV